MFTNSTNGETVVSRQAARCCPVVSSKKNSVRPSDDAPVGRRRSVALAIASSGFERATPVVQACCRASHLVS
jgi:hypothetical protein